MTVWRAVWRTVKRTVKRTVWRTFTVLRIVLNVGKNYQLEIPMMENKNSLGKLSKLKL